MKITKEEYESMKDKKNWKKNFTGNMQKNIDGFSAFLQKNGLHYMIRANRDGSIELGLNGSDGNIKEFPETTQKAIDNTLKTVFSSQITYIYNYMLLSISGGTEPSDADKKKADSCMLALVRHLEMAEYGYEIYSEYVFALMDLIDAFKAGGEEE